MSGSRSVPHDSAIKHVSGQSIYVDDMHVDGRLLHGRVVYSPHARAAIARIDLEEARALPGVHAVLCHADVPGHNQMGPVQKDEPCLAEREVSFIGQAVVLIAAESEEIARQAEKLARIEYEVLPAVLTLEEAIARGDLLAPERVMQCGDVDAALRAAPRTVKGSLRTGGQEHWYLETHACLCVPGEGREIVAYSSTQHPSETQTLIAEVLGVPKNEVVVEVRRMGGAFGGKETQANHTACWCALLCRATRRPVKIRLFRDDDQKMTGKRHPFLIEYEAGFDDDGKLLAVKFLQHADGGATVDLSPAILQRAMLHADNAYFVPNMRVTGRVYRTNLPSNTAFRGFGGPQGVAGMEAVIDHVARSLGKDALEVRRLNFYGETDRNRTHYGQVVENNRLERIYSELTGSCSYAERRKAIRELNAKSVHVKRGLALTPIKFGISFTTSHLNQAGALVNIYGDGSVLVNHGGTEMGQGLHTKIQQIAAAELGVSLEHVKVNATNTSKVPNTSATAASAGTDLNGMAVKNAIDKLKARMAETVANLFNAGLSEGRSEPAAIVFESDRIFDRTRPERAISFADAALLMIQKQVSLSATGFYRTPDIHFDVENGQGKPFHYFSFGMAATEVEVDTLTGRHEIVRADLLHDVGESINSGIDIGQVEGGYVQGVGWCTTEDIKHDSKGNLLNHSPDTYKIPSVRDVPKDFRVALLKDAPNPIAIRRSKAVAEPPLMLGLSAWLAIKDAISAIADHRLEPRFSLPATNELILLSVEDLKRRLRDPGAQ